MLPPLKFISKMLLVDNSFHKEIQNKILKSAFVLFTVPFKRGNKVKIDKYSGSVQSINLFYMKLNNRSRNIYIPTSFIFDEIIEVEK